MDTEAPVVVTPRVRPALPQRRAAPSWLASIDLARPLAVKSSPNGEIIVLFGSATAVIVAANTGHVRARFATSERLRSVVTDESVVIQSAHSIVSYDFRGRSYRWTNAFGIIDLIGGSRTVYAVRHATGNVPTPATLLAFGPFGGLRWSQSLPRQNSLLAMLPDDIAVVQYTTGEPQFTYDSGIEPRRGREVWSCFNVEPDPVVLINGIAQCRLYSDGPSAALDEYHPAYIRRFAYVGGRNEGLRAYRPDAAHLATKENGREADAVFSDARSDYVGIAGRLFRYEHEGTPWHPLLLEGMSPSGRTVGRSVVLHRHGFPFALTMRNGLPELIPLAIPATTVAAEKPFAPYLVEKTQAGWLAVNVDRPTSLTRFGGLCSSALVVAARRSLVFACARGGATVVTSFPVEVQPSPDAIDRDGSQRNPVAYATPDPTPEPVDTVLTMFEIDANRTRDDLRPRLLSPAVRSVVLTVDHRASLPAQNLSAGRSNCRAVFEGVTCQVKLPIPFGEHRITLVFFDRPGGAGVALASTSARILLNGAPDNVDLDIRGIPASVLIRAHDPSAQLRAGHPADISLDVVAIDHDGFPILNQGDYLHPIAVRLVNPPGATGLSTNKISAARTPLVLRYDGSRASALTVVASARGVSDVQLTLPIAP